MQKIPTIFDRDWDGDRSRVLDRPHPDCAWVFAGEGVATRKLDGTCCLVRGGRLYKRHEVKPGKEPPDGFEPADRDDLTLKMVGWVPVGDGPEDRWHREARGGEVDGTYELVGPKIQGNPERWPWHELVPHGLLRPVEDVPMGFDAMREWLGRQDIEGIVFHHADGRMAKIKLRDFGLKRPAPNPLPSASVSGG